MNHSFTNTLFQVNGCDSESMNMWWHVLVHTFITLKCSKIVDKLHLPHFNGVHTIWKVKMLLSYFERDCIIAEVCTKSIFFKSYAKLINWNCAVFLGNIHIWRHIYKKNYIDILTPPHHPSSRYMESIIRRY